MVNNLYFFPTDRLYLNQLKSSTFRIFRSKQLIIILYIGEDGDDEKQLVGSGHRQKSVCMLSVIMPLVSLSNDFLLPSTPLLCSLLGHRELAHTMSRQFLWCGTAQAGIMHPLLY